MTTTTMAAPSRTHNYGFALEKYMLLQEQHEELCHHLQQIRPRQYSTSSISTRSSSVSSTSPRRRHSRSGRMRCSGAADAGLDTIVDEETLYEISAEEQRLFDVNESIKRALTELLNCDTVRCDKSMRMWAQARLMETEKELRSGRAMSVLLETSMGDIVIDLLVDHAPKLCEKSFLKLCKIKYYNFSPVHSVQKNFSFQTGDPLGPLSKESDGGSSIWGVSSGNSSLRTFPAFFHPKLKHLERGTVSMATVPLTSDPDTRVAGSQFIITLGEDTDFLDGKAAIFGKVVEGFDALEKINEAIVDDKGYPLVDIRIKHTVILDDPYPDPENLREPSSSPPPTEEQLKTVRIADEAALHADDGVDEEELERRRRNREAQAQALTLEMMGDLPFAEVKPPENILFVCKLNPVTADEDLELIFGRFGKILSCEVIRDQKTGDSLQYAFIEYEDKASCEAAYFKMQGVLIDDRRIHVDFSQSVSKLSDVWRKDANTKRRANASRGGWGGVDELEKRRQYRAQAERDTGGRRYSSFRTPYLPSYVERDAAEHPHHHHHRESNRMIMADRDGVLDDSASQRKRIAVACGRCRKRKIRCSGDAGNGQPCTNCKNASHAPCQFLRVSSQEVSHVKGNAFTYNVDASRMMQARGSSAVSPLVVPANAYHEGLGLSDVPVRTSRGDPAAAYGDKQYYSPPGWTGAYGGTAVDYALCQPAFQMSATGSPYVTGAYPLTTNPGGVKGDGMMYLDTGTAYGYTAVPTSTASVSRQSPGSETAFPYQSATPGLSSSVNSSNERLPPTPSRTLPSSGTSIYRSEGVGSDYRKTSQLTGPDAASGLGIELSAGYQAYDNAHVSYSSQVGGQLSRAAELYTTQSSDGAPEGSLRSQVAGGTESPFRYTDGSVHRQGPNALAGGQYYLYHRHGQSGECALPTDMVPASTGDPGSGSRGQKSPARSR
ncbi:Tyrosine-tRNA ligase [Purpureocillium lavendulum]|uniref:Peptidyl-prolyl cis-trans isomerase-like 4 n=1 Tax=Purpureocillium lavendulum TaxID=1247861 RepID=A0AB34FF21_9HYPO|nr:Tyrosine-tRNA ligase [Purpureocillium lavendulum]